MSAAFALPAVAAEGFEDAKAYDAHRPTYPPEAVESLLQHLKIAGQPNLNVVEIASGTGKFTELLAVRPESYNIVAVEPHHGMRDQLVAKALPGVKTLDGHAARIPVEDHWGDACIAAQSFHWFATKDALDEVYRVLADKAIFGMIWNIEDYNKPRSWKATTSWEQKLNDWVWSISNDGHPRFRDQQWREVFQSQLNLPKFSLPLGEESIEWTVWLTEDALWSRLNTLSQVAILKGPERDAAVRTFREALQLGDVERNDKGEIAVHGHTYYAWTDRI
ncbi:S-adenosyl-L-methionine-dependent methyltransferase [Thozetella sp. PMI_491]|nr:S-adenosyl-L-methionine-dependent methyltransferase [Thozetella sp. PMI_491]